MPFALPFILFLVDGVAILTIEKGAAGAVFHAIWRDGILRPRRVVPGMEATVVPVFTGGACLEPEMKNSSPVERRQAVRFRCQASVCCYPAAAEQQARPAQARDLSVSGIGLTLREPCELGELFEVRIKNSTGEREVVRLMLIIHLRPEAPGSWAAGGMFYRELGWKEVQELRT
jgi:hypothetical protein